MEYRVTREQTLDFQTVVFIQIQRILDAINQGDDEKAMKDIDALITLLSFAWDEDFTKQIRKTREQFEQDLARFGTNEDLRKWATHRYNMNRLKHIIRLLQRRGIIEYQVQAIGLLIPERVKEMLLEMKRRRKKEEGK